MGITFSKDLPVPLDVSPGYKSKKNTLLFPENNNSSDSESKEDSVEQISDSSDKNSRDQSNDFNKQSNINQLLTNNQQLEKEIEKFVEEWFSSNEQVDLEKSQQELIIPLEKMIYKKHMIGVTVKNSGRVSNYLSESRN